jgi:hypothetical protein
MDRSFGPSGGHRRLGYPWRVCDFFPNLTADKPQFVELRSPQPACAGIRKDHISCNWSPLKLSRQTYHNRTLHPGPIIRRTWTSVTN